MKLFSSKTFRKSLDILSDNQKGQLWEVCFLYANKESYSHMDQFVQFVFSQNIEKYFLISEKRSEAVATRYTIPATPTSPALSNTIHILNISTPRTWTAEELRKGYNEPEELHKKLGLWDYFIEPIGEEEEKSPPAGSDEIYIPKIEKILSAPKDGSINEPSKSRFPQRPEEYCPFPEPDLSILWPAPEGFWINTQFTWDEFLTFDKKALNDLPLKFNMYIGKDIQERMTQIDRIKDAEPIPTT